MANVYGGLIANQANLRPKVKARLVALSGRKRAPCVHKLAAGAEMQTGTHCEAIGSGGQVMVEDRRFEPLTS